MRKRGRRVIVNLNHGLGNQLSLYFAGLAYAIKFNRELIAVVQSENQNGHDSFREIAKLNLPGVFVIKRKANSQFLNKLSQFLAFRIPHSLKFTKKYYSSVLGYDDKLFSDSGIRNINGFFHAYFYYEDCLSKYQNLNADTIIPLSPVAKEIAANIKSGKSTAIHIRRGDYLHHNLSFGLLNENYYRNALSRLEALSGATKIYVFSDDVVFAKTLMERIGQNDATFPEEICPLSASEVIYLIGSADNIVIANSTLSYWAGVLANKGSNVIAPRPFYRNQTLSGNYFYKPDWILLDSDFN